MRRIPLMGLSLWLSLATWGCTDWPAEQPADPDIEISSLHKQIREIEALLAAEQERSKNLAARANELAARDRDLTAGISRLKLANEQQQKIIEALKAAPAERDLYKRRAEALALELSRRAARIAELERQIAKLKAANPAADQGATRPDEARRP